MSNKKMTDYYVLTIRDAETRLVRLGRLHHTLQSVLRRTGRRRLELYTDECVNHAFRDAFYSECKDNKKFCAEVTKGNLDDGFDVTDARLDEYYEPFLEILCQRLDQPDLEAGECTEYDDAVVPPRVAYVLQLWST